MMWVPFLLRWSAAIFRSQAKLWFSTIEASEMRSSTSTALDVWGPLVSPQKNRKNKLMCYPQQLGRSWKDFVPEPSGTLSAKLCATDTSATLSAICTRTIRNFTAFWTRTFRNLTSHLHQNSPEACLFSVNMPSNSPQTLLAICPEPSEPHQPSGTLQNLVCTTPFETSSAICTGRNSLELHQLSSPEPSEPHQPSAPEPSGTFSGTWCCNWTGSHQSYSGLKAP